MKIRTKLSLFFTIVFLLIFFAFSSVFIYIFTKFVITENDKHMEMMKKDILKKINLYDIKTVEDIKRIDLKNLYGTFFLDNNITQYLWLAIYDDDKNMVSSTKFAAKYPIILKDEMIIKNRSFYHFSGIEPNHFFRVNERNEAEARLHIVTVYKNNIKFYIVIAQSITDEMKYIKETHNIIINSLLIVLFVVLITGLLYSFYTLHPINNIIMQLGLINKDNLSKRLIEKNNDDEINMLVKSVNHLLARVENGVLLEKQFISDVSHEFKTPIFILRLNIENVLQNESLKDEEIDKLTNSLAILYSMGNLIEKMLYLTQLELGTKKIITENVEIESLIKKAIDTLQPIADSKNISIYMEDCESKTIYKADKELLYRALFNLIENGIKYTDSGFVKIGTIKKTDCIIIKISDSGIGIPIEKKDAIFERFYRINNSRNDEKGHGIGLAVTKRIITLHNGTITVNSSNNEGSEFIITLPIKNT